MYIADGSKSIQYGKEHEEDGIAYFEKENGLKVYKCGIYLHESGILGASPDGLISRNDIIEIKCPYSLRQCTDIKNGIKESKLPSLEVIEDEIKLKTGSDWYHQIQGQLYITKAQICHLVIYSPNSSRILTINRAPEWDKNISLLINFYKSYYIDFVSKAINNVDIDF